MKTKQQQSKESSKVEILAQFILKRKELMSTKEQQENKEVIDYDSESWKQLKWDIGQIQMNHLSIGKLNPTCIEANPATHRIAELVYHKIAQLEKEKTEMKEPKPLPPIHSKKVSSFAWDIYYKKLAEWESKHPISKQLQSYKEGIDRMIQNTKSKHDAFLGSRGQENRDSFKNGLSWSIESMEQLLKDAEAH